MTNMEPLSWTFVADKLPEEEYDGLLLLSVRSPHYRSSLELGGWDGTDFWIQHRYLQPISGEVYAWAYIGDTAPYGRRDG